MAKTVSLTLSTSRRSGGHKKRKGTKKRRASLSGGRSRNHVKALPRRAYKRGSFKRYCAREGFSGANSKCIAKALASGSTKRKRQAVLVRTLNRIRPK